MSSLNQGTPGVPQAPMVDGRGIPTSIWYTFFVTLWNRTGGALGNPSIIIDVIASIPGSILFRGASVWQGLKIGLPFQVLRSGAAFPEWDFLDGKSFGPQDERAFLAAPQDTAGDPIFREIATPDLDSIAGQFPGTRTNDNAGAGNVGEFVASTIPIGDAVPLASGTSADIASITLTAGDWDIWASFTSDPDLTTTQSDIRAWVNSVSATDPGPPNRGCYGEMNLPIPAGLTQTLALGSMRMRINLTTIFFLSANVSFAAANLSGYGFLGARRRR